MDLDAGISAVLEQVKKTGSLDVQDEYFIKYFDIYSDIHSQKEKIIKQGYQYSTYSYFENKEKIVDIRELLKIQNIYDFIECAYMAILSRTCEKNVIADITKRLENKEISKEAYLEALEFSDEAKDKDVKLIGYSVFDVKSLSNLSLKEFVKIAFLRLLEREADSYGLKDFTIKLKIGELSRDEVIEKIVYSQEANGKTLPTIIYSDSKDEQKKKLFCENAFNENELEVISKDYDDMDNLEKCYLKSKNEIKFLNIRINELKDITNEFAKRIEFLEYLSNNNDKDK